MRRYRTDRLFDVPEPACYYELNIYLEPSARLYLNNPTAPLAGKTLTFKAGGAVVCNAKTDATGLAQCSGVLSLLQTVLSFGYTVSYAGDVTYQGSSATGALIES